MSQQSETTVRLEKIEGVKPPNGEHYVTAKQVLERSDDLVEQELTAIGSWLEKTGHDKGNLMGLALSGGGIRSATFSLGVLQALARNNILRKLDYLSTVSGGGYIGSSLSWWLCQGKDTGLAPEDFPYGCDRTPDTETDTPAQKRLRYLSQHGKYLTPGNGITLLSGIAIVLRAILLNLAVWLPVLVVIMALLIWVSSELGSSLAASLPAWIPIFPLLHEKDFLFRSLLNFALLLTVLYALYCLFYSLCTAQARGETSSRRYGSRRQFERITGYGLAAVGALLVVGSLPVVAHLLEGYQGATGPVAVLVGIASTVRSFFKSGEKLRGMIPLGVQVSLGAVFLIYGLLLTAFSASDVLIQQKTVSGVPVAFLFAGLALFALLFGWFANLNYISMHRFYRDRLMEAFLPNPENALYNRTDAATQADPVRLSDIDNATSGRGPYHIINTNVLLVDSGRRRWRIRGGDNFILSPLFCGSNATGWCGTEGFLGDGMTLATAMAISGAAANPNTGVGGVGLTRNPLVSILMALLNLRLGYWAHNPLQPPSHGRRPNHFRPGAYEVGSLFDIGGLREDRPFVQLSDGGHFENLAMYELIRRKLRLILVCDGGADKEFTFGDLQTTLRRINEDFGATVDFPRGHRPAILVPSQNAGYPKDTKRAARGYIVGDITYHDGSRGKLIFMKTTMVPGVSTAVKGYKGAHPDFPDESTADQFFDEEQFEAYRELGHHIAEEMVAGLDLPTFIDAIERAKGEQDVPTPGAEEEEPGDET